MEIGDEVNMSDKRLPADKRSVLYIIEDIQKDLEYYVVKLETSKMRLERELKI